jgi:hypothetical protein
MTSATEFGPNVASRRTASGVVRPIKLSDADEIATTNHRRNFDYLRAAKERGSAPACQ